MPNVIICHDQKVFSDLSHSLCRAVLLRRRPRKSSDNWCQTRQTLSHDRPQAWLQNLHPAVIRAGTGLVQGLSALYALGPLTATPGGPAYLWPFILTLQLAPQQEARIMPTYDARSSSDLLLSVHDLRPPPLLPSCKKLLSAQVCCELSAASQWYRSALPVQRRYTLLVEAKV